MFGTKKTKKQVKTIKRTTRDSIPYYRVYENGTIETSQGVFTRAYLLDDINFKIAAKEEQVRIFREYGSILNSISPDVKFQIIIHNLTANEKEFLNEILIEQKDDNLNDLRREMNSILLANCEGRNNLTQNKYFVVEVKDSSVDRAMQILDQMDIEINKMFRHLSKESTIVPQTLQERLHTLFTIYNQDGEAIFNNDINEDGVEYFNVAKMRKLGQSSKDIIGPSGLKFNDDSSVVGQTFARTLYLEGIPNWLSTEFLADLSEISSNMLISVHYEPVDSTDALKMINNMMINIDGEIDAQMQKVSSSSLVSTRLKQQQHNTKELYEDISNRDQKVFFVTVVCTVFGETKEMMIANAKQVSKVANKYFCSMRTLMYQQENGFNASLPLCLNELKTSKMLTTESASIFLPYTTQELHQRHGFYYGVNATSKNMIIYNRLMGANYNSLIFGDSGYGKSCDAKFEILNVLLQTSNTVVYVIDPDGEYVKMAERLGGEVINLAPGSKTYLNPLDMDLAYGDDNDPLSLKIDYILSLMEIMLGGDRVLEAAEKSIITRCSQNIYKDYLEYLDRMNRQGKNITCDRNSTPTLTNLHSAIATQPEPEAKNIAAVLEMYASGSMATFAHRTSVNTNARFIVYNIKNLGSGTRDLGMHICLNDILNKMYENRKNDIYTFMYIDEFSSLLKSPSSLSFISQIWKRCRKNFGVPTGIMQNTEDVLANREARTLINTTSFIRMVSMQKSDRLNLQTLLGLSNEQLAHIDNNRPGHGLIYTGKTILPFENDIPESSEIYKMIRTDGKEIDYQTRISFKR